MVEMVILQATYTRVGKIEDITITQHHLDHHIQIVISQAFTIGGQPGQVVEFITLTHISIPIMSFMDLTLLVITCKQHKTPVKKIFEGNLL